MRNRLPQIVVLDLDNTIYDYNECNKKATEDVINLLVSKIKISKTEALKIWTQGRASIKKRLKNTAASHSRILYIREGFNLFGFKSELSLCLEIENMYWNTFIMEMKIRKGFEDFINLARFNDIKVILVTDLTDQIQLRKISFLGLENTFDFVITSELVGGDKISALPMKYLLSHLTNEEKKSHFWFIGDSTNDFPQNNKYSKISHENFLISNQMKSFAKIDKFKDFVKIEKILCQVLAKGSNSGKLK